MNAADFAVFAESLQSLPRAILQIDNDTTFSGAEECKLMLRYKTVVYSAPEQRAKVRYFYDEFSNRIILPASAVAHWKIWRGFRVGVRVWF